MTPNFSLEEFTRSQTAARRGIDNTPSEVIKLNILRVAYKLEIIRMVIDRPITITSGYRCIDLNRLIGGATNSAHTQGLAVDFVVGGMTPEQIIKEIKHVVNYKQIINEFGRWVHLAIPEKQTGKHLIAERIDGKVKYTNVA